MTNSDSDKATPRPWRVRTTEWDDGEVITPSDIVDANGKSIYTEDAGDYCTMPDKTAVEIVQAVNERDALLKQLNMFRILEKNLSDAYLRIRELVGSFDTSTAPTPKQVYDLTELKLKTLLAEREELRKRVEELEVHNLSKCFMHQEKIEQLESDKRELIEALEKTITSLVSYKYYIPKPYKQNPIYIMGAYEAEKEAVRLLKKHTPKQSQDK
jgi:hypothetical protein